ncbi:transmembrane protein [Ceratobasidium sp. AG-Ba]|nr:transmembrane protein [Ceratobasidium sp. AG-Ba]
MDSLRGRAASMTRTQGWARSELDAGRQSVPRREWRGAGRGGNHEVDSPIHRSPVFSSSRLSPSFQLSSLSIMQFKSSFARLAAFAFFLLSFTMLVCAAPAPASSGLAVRDSSLVARGGDGTAQCKALLVTAKADVDAAVKELAKCATAAGLCVDVDVKIKVIVDIFIKLIADIKALVALNLTVNVLVIIQAFLDVLIVLFVGLKACVGLTAEICADLSLYIKLYIDLILELCLTVVVKLAVAIQIKACLDLYASVLVYLKLDVIIAVLVKLIASLSIL